MSTEEIKPDLFNVDKKDNVRLANLVDEAKWTQLIDGYDEGKGKPLLELLADLLES